MSPRDETVSHLDADTLVSLERLLGPAAEEAASHLAGCRGCREELRSLAEIRRALEPAAPLEPALRRRLTAALRRERAAEEKRARLARWAAALALAFAAAGAAAAILAFALGASGTPPSPAALAVTALALGATAAWRSLRRAGGRA